MSLIIPWLHVRDIDDIFLNLDNGGQNNQISDMNFIGFEWDSLWLFQKLNENLLF